MTSWYERLSSLDSCFLAFENRHSTMHIGAVALFDGAALATADGGIDIERIRRYVTSHLADVPRYRQKLAYIPFDNHPVWVDEAHLDMGYHVRHTSVPRPGDEAQLREVCARLFERRLDRRKPLWEMWVIEGLRDGRFALLMKVHHCMVDGMGGVELLAALLRPDPDASIPPHIPAEPRRTPSAARLLRDEIVRRAEMGMGLVRWLQEAGTFRDVDPPWPTRVRAVWQLVRDGMHRPQPTPLNQPLGPHRRVHWTTWDLATVRNVKAHLGGTVNDVVLSAVGGAVRAFFGKRQFSMPGEFRAAVPVNMRSEADRHSLGNRVSSWLVALPIEEPCAVRRLQAVQDVSHRFKVTHQAVGSQTLLQAAEWTTANALTLGALLMDRVQPFNLIVTNIAGPQMPLYLLGARMEAIYPQVPLFEHQNLGIALFSYNGKIFWGFNADWDALPDLEEFVKALADAFDDLRRAVPAPRRWAPKRSRPSHGRTRLPDVSELPEQQRDNRPSHAVG